MAYGRAISKERNSRKLNFGIKTVFLKSHNGFIVCYETVVATYNDFVGQFLEEKGNLFEDGHPKRITYRI